MRNKNNSKKTAVLHLWDQAESVSGGGTRRHVSLDEAAAAAEVVE